MTTIYNTGVFKHSSGNTFYEFTLALKHDIPQNSSLSPKVHGLQTSGCRWILIYTLLWLYVKGWCFSSQSQVCDPKKVEQPLPQEAADAALLSSRVFIVILFCFLLCPFPVPVRRYFVLHSLKCMSEWWSFRAGMNLNNSSHLLTWSWSLRWEEFPRCLLGEPRLLGCSQNSCLTL